MAVGCVQGPVALRHAEIGKRSQKSVNGKIKKICLSVERPVFCWNAPLGRWRERLPETISDAVMTN